MKLNFLTLLLFLFLILVSCDKKEDDLPEISQTILYTVSGQVVDSLGEGMEGVSIFSDFDFVLTDNEGKWRIDSLSGIQTITPYLIKNSFDPLSIDVNTNTSELTFLATLIISETETQIFNWFNDQQLPNGLLESVEDGNIVSLYDQALSAMVFMIKGDIINAEKIFNHYNDRVEDELTNGNGGFFQFRDANGVPSTRRWMGDNAWLLIALNNYKDITGNTTYDNMALELANWLIGLQDIDGGLIAGYNNGSPMTHKVTEGNIDAFNAINGYTDFHSDLLDFLEEDRWDPIDKNLVSWPTNPPYLYAMDLHPWGYSMFNDFPVSALTTADRYVTTQTATVNGAQITGHCFDVDKDTVWPEGMGQMALAFGIAGMQTEKEYYLAEMEKVFIQSTTHTNAGGFPYASNPGTSYGTEDLWVGADTNIAISGGAWYIFAKFNFNPFAVGRDKDIPTADMFWLE